MVKKSLLNVLLLIIVGFFVATFFYFSLTSKPKPQTQELSKEVSLKETKPKFPEETEIPVSDKIESQKEKIYFVKYKEGNCFFVDLSSGEVQNPIPSGYGIVSEYSDHPFPDFFILVKNDELFSYSLKDGSLNKISITLPKYPEGKSEVDAYPSISEKHKFYLEILKPKEFSEFAGWIYEKVKSYFFDAKTNQLQSADNINLSELSEGCFEYDSKYSRFFIWACGEGIGESLPLWVYDFKNNKKEEIITLKDFGLEDIDPGQISVNYSAGDFIAIPKSKEIFSKIVIVTPGQEITKKVFTVSPNVSEKLEETYPYSSLFAKDQNTIVIGGGHFILLLKVDANGQIVESKYFPDSDLYANSIFYHDGKLYYQSRSSQSLKVINLENWEIEKTIPLEPGDEITSVVSF